MDNANLAGHAVAEMPKSPRSSPNPIRVIDVVIFPAVQLLDVAGPVQVFTSANDLVTQAGGAPPYLVRVVAQGGEKSRRGRHTIHIAGNGFDDDSSDLSLVLDEESFNRREIVIRNIQRELRQCLRDARTLSDSERGEPGASLR